MVARSFIVRHNDAEFTVDYETEDGLEVLKFQIFSLTSVLPDDQKIIAGEGGLVVTDASDLGTISEKLRLVSIEEAPETTLDSPDHLEISDLELARILQAEEEALLFQEFHASKDGGEFQRKIRPYVDQVLLYEDPARQEAARNSVPVDKVEEKALVSLAKEGKFRPSKDEEDHAFLLQLLFWFKQSFRLKNVTVYYCVDSDLQLILPHFGDGGPLVWINSPPCDKCGSGTINIGMGAALPCEIKFGGSRIELYRCNICSSITRFPRYNDPLKLLETRSGRCGEWANCFTLYCRAFGFVSRLILDFTDHVWTECYSHFLGSWNKNLNYVIAISKDGVRDVTKRYTRKWHEILPRRSITTEAVVSSILSGITKECRVGYSSEALTLLEYRDRKETEELEEGVHQQIDALLSLPGRKSGAIEWRKARSEVGSSENNSFSCSSCPVRICVDAHVTSIYNAFVSLISYILDNCLSKAKSIEILEMLKGFLVELRSTSFKERRSILDLNSSQYAEKLMPCIERLLSAISVKKESGNKGRVFVSLSGAPVQTSIALPVALDVVDEIIDDFNNNNYIGKDVMQFPKFNRLSSGSVLASGEELPLGIATAAFDGTRSSKWEEPNGAKGCWLIYKVAKMHDLESYAMMSANDAPERDPMDWIVEGSEDGGVSWNALDIQSSQIFEKRFQRRMYRVETRRMSNAFRFRFLAVRDPKETSRFQIGGIDLYSKPS